MIKSIYLDNNSTTQIDPKVLEVMLPYFSEKFGNPASSSHRFGIEASVGVDIARKQIAELINSEDEEIFFTSGTTESVNLTLKGLAENSSTKNHLIATNIEHSVVLKTLEYLEKLGFSVTLLKVDNKGLINIEQLINSITEKTFLVSIVHANNEIGVIQNIESIGKICNEKKIFFHLDAAQSFGKIPIDVKKMEIDFLSFSGHKIYGPKGIGGLYKRKECNLSPQMLGGGQENGLRSGTLNVAGIVGMGEAARIAKIKMEEENFRLKNLANKLLNGISSKIENVYLNGCKENRLANNLNLRFDGIVADTLMMNMKEIAISTGSACSTLNGQGSRILMALGLTSEEAKSSIRIGLGRFTTEEEINYVIEKLINTVNKLRA
ncbi:MAG: cysteine desulfurase NifS [Chlorobiaceae bacterium]|nr:cysteine desulfurase NifS [Chlorobiaceae bacterium]MBA4310724.1 cysteine desulfurase NifS [Chlorobiaceae bacterium]